MFRRRNQDRPEREPILYFFGGRRSTHTITETGYQVFISATFGVWTLVLVIIVFWVRIVADIDQQDLANTAQVASGLSAVALALLAIVHELNSGERYLKLGLATLSFLFISSALLAGISLLVYSANVVFRPTITIYVVLSLIVVLGVFNVGKRLRWSLYIFSPFLTPLLVLVTISDAVLPTSALLLLIGATIGLAALSAVFIAQVFLARPQPTAEEEFIRVATERWKRDVQEFIRIGEIKEIILDILREKQAEQFREGVPDWSKLSGKDLLVKEDEMELELRQRKLFEQEDLLREALTELRNDTGKVHHKYEGGYVYYLAPTTDQVTEAEHLVSDLSLVLLRSNRNLRGGSWVWEHDYTPMLRLLCERMNYPLDVVQKYFWPACQAIVERQFATALVVEDSSDSFRNRQALLARRSDQVKTLAALIGRLDQMYADLRAEITRKLGAESVDDYDIQFLIGLLIEWPGGDSKPKMRRLRSPDVEKLIHMGILRPEEWITEKGLGDVVADLAKFLEKWRSEADQIVQELCKLELRTLPEDLLEHLTSRREDGHRLRLTLDELVSST